jgi:putative tryptophan/tyrosine transport system substrate-binding protein
MNRREFIAGLGGAVAWPRAVRAQQPKIPLVGFLNSGEIPRNFVYVNAFRQGLKDRGFIEGQNLAVEYRYAQNHLERLPELAADLVRRNVAAIAANGGTPVAVAANAATSTIPIIFMVSDDPVQSGLVASFNRPGGNLTGTYLVVGDLWPKLFALIVQLLPKSRVFAVLASNGTPDHLERLRQEAQPTADAIGRNLLFMTAFTPQEIDQAFAALARQGVEALVIGPSPLVLGARVQLAILAARYAIPAIYPFRDNAEAGGLMSYGIKLDESYRLLGDYVGRILKGEKPGDLPVQQPTKFEFVINLKTAKALGLNLPSTMLAIADEVIE